MSTDNPRITFTLSNEMKERVDAYRFANRIKSQTQAIVTLMDRGFELMNYVRQTEESFSDEDRRLLSAYHAAEPTARQFALEMLENHPAKAEERRA